MCSSDLLNVMRSLEAPHFDTQRTTWGPTGETALLIQDTLTALDWDGKTPIPHLAKSWTLSADGKTYTFHLRDDVTFCSGKKLTSEDVVFTFMRLKALGSRAPFGWRAGRIKEVRAAGPHTVEYELDEPYSELPLQLTMWTNTIHNKDQIEQLGVDYGVKTLDGTGPYCWVSWTPRDNIVLRRHDAYRWGPSMYKNPGPAKFEKLSIKIVPEDSSRLAAMLSGAGNAVFHPADYAILNARVSSPRLGHAFSIHGMGGSIGWAVAPLDRKSTRLNSSH